jgi:antitoxin (DNA-binding transcriptional repressor) of toxin-antitoxin stability system
MKKISIRTLHDQTGRWIRRAAEGAFVVTDHGRPIACVQPYTEELTRHPLPDHSALMARIPRIDVDSTAVISEDRSRG